MNEENLENFDPNKKLTVKLINDKENKKSIVWKYFGHLCIDGEASHTNFYFCKICVETNRFLKPK